MNEQLRWSDAQNSDRASIDLAATLTDLKIRSTEEIEAEKSRETEMRTSIASSSNFSVLLHVLENLSPKKGETVTRDSSLCRESHMHLSNLIAFIRERKEAGKGAEETIFEAIALVEKGENEKYFLPTVFGIRKKVEELLHTAGSQLGEKRPTGSPLDLDISDRSFDYVLGLAL